MRPQLTERSDRKLYCRIQSAEAILLWNAEYVRRRISRAKL